MNNIAYICDRRACIDCTNDDCTHTTNIDHAKNFIKGKDGKYIEVVNTEERQSTDETLREICQDFIGVVEETR